MNARSAGNLSSLGSRIKAGPGVEHPSGFDSTSHTAAIRQAVKTSIDKHTRTIRAQMAALGRRLDEGESSEQVVWVIPNALGCVHRPLRHHPVFGRDKKGRYLPPEASGQVLHWIGRLRQLGIASIISLMHPNEFKHYAQLNLGARDLLEAYRNAGFEVTHVPWDDPAHRPGLTDAAFHEELERVRGEALKMFNELPKPVVLHCSAGIDRSSPVAAFIACARAMHPNA